MERERWRELDRERDGERWRACVVSMVTAPTWMLCVRESERERESVYVCVCVCVCVCVEVVGGAECVFAPKRMKAGKVGPQPPHAPPPGGHRSDQDEARTSPPLSAYQTSSYGRLRSLGFLPHFLSSCLAS